MSISCQFWGIDGFSLEVTDFDEIRHFRKMTRHNQTSNTTNKFHIPEQSEGLGGHFLLWNFEIGLSFLFVTYNAKMEKNHFFSSKIHAFWENPQLLGNDATQPNHFTHRLVAHTKSKRNNRRSCYVLIVSNVIIHNFEQYEENPLKYFIPARMRSATVWNGQ